ncbi:hypothetical protein [Pseudonocardia humida]|uniref:Septum formation-related domain-containing protein n=1 Tax=Pseudonocardia humida TaxID=2800819 RepID=A0ABT0ZWY9_9PSEU|nr:hypothetical protein [Pseudonocardia humida]MCO1655255.1 hypothetical protein [Pseudonocardia humida]
MAGRLVVAAALVVLPGAAAAVWATRPSAAPGPDVFAVDQVAQRYRALGADLLAGALRCAPLPPSPSPGQTERVGCEVPAGAATLTRELTSFDTVLRLRAARAAAPAPAPDSARSGGVTEAGAAFAMDQTVDGVSHLYWDTESPRPVSAAVRSGELPMAAVVALHDQRRFTGVARPSQPGEAFASPQLWQPAAVVLTDGGAGRDGVECTAVPPAPQYPGTVELVSCRSRRRAGRLRAGRRRRGVEPAPVAPAAPDGIEPGTQWIGGWADEDGADDGRRLSCYEPVGPEPARLYHDRRDRLSFGLLFGGGLPAEQLHRFRQG